MKCESKKNNPRERTRSNIDRNPVTTTADLTVSLVTNHSPDRDPISRTDTNGVVEHLETFLSRLAVLRDPDVGLVELHLLDVVGEVGLGLEILEDSDDEE